jgi:galactokinase
VNLIGDHTDYSGGMVLPMAIDLTTVVEGERRGGEVRLVSDNLGGLARTSLEGETLGGRSSADDVRAGHSSPGVAAADQPSWTRFVAAVVAEVRPASGFVGRVATDLPIGAGLASSAALTVALALALGHEGDPLELARAAQRAEQRATGVPCGIMDQLTAVVAQAGSALLIDCTTLAVVPVTLPPDADVVVVHSGQPRTLAHSAYARRRAECEAAAAIVGPLATATLGELGAIGDPVLLARARHVVTENARVRAAAGALGAGDVRAVGRLMSESHESLRDFFEVSTPALDDLVLRLTATPGVFGARLTGAGFGGCVVALTRPGALTHALASGELTGWRVRPVAGARLTQTT